MNTDLQKQYIQNNDDVLVLQQFLAELNLVPKVEQIDVKDSFNRVTARSVFALKCDPTYNASAMDGIQVNSADTACASEQTPLKLKEGKDFVYVNTGGAILQPQFDSVVMIEDVIKLNKGEVAITSPSYPWQNVRVVGESIAAGELIVASHHLITPQDIGALVASGNSSIPVFAFPKVAILPTGGEMVQDAAQLAVGKLMESNSKVFSALCEKYNAIPNVYPITQDDIQLLKDNIAQAVKDNDIVLVNAGSSAGTKDYTVRAIEQLGRVVAHGIALKPGKPTILGIVEGKPVIGIPGYPVSAFLVFELFVKPLLLQLAGLDNQAAQTVQATLSRRITSSFKNAELVRMTVGRVDGRLVATPLSRNAADIMTLVRADGLLKVPRLCEGIEEGTAVEISLLKPLAKIERSLVVTGSHDMILDLIADKLDLTSAHVGSMGGIAALLRHECHIAPIHLLDEDGQYNVSYVKKYFPDRKMALIKGVGRIQGYVVPKGNPKGIADIKQLASSGEKKIIFANRQRGAGTRILFDYLLKQNAIEPNSICGYDKEYGTHLSVAVAVANNVADTGIAVMSAANALGLDFLPICQENYDFLTPYEYLSDERVVKFVQVLKSTEFTDSLRELGGYSWDDIGSVQVIE